MKYQHIIYWYCTHNLEAYCTPTTNIWWILQASYNGWFCKAMVIIMYSACNSIQNLVLKQVHSLHLWLCSIYSSAYKSWFCMRNMRRKASFEVAMWDGWIAKTTLHYLTLKKTSWVVKYSIVQLWTGNSIKHEFEQLLIKKLQTTYFHDMKLIQTNLLVTKDHRPPINSYNIYSAFQSQQ